MFKSIMWATDGSAAADRAMPYVKALASDSGAEVVVFHADPLLMGRAGGQHELADEDSVEAKIARQAGELRDAGLKAGEQLIHVGDGESPAQTIADAAKELRADVIVARRAAAGRHNQPPAAHRAVPRVRGAGRQGRLGRGGPEGQHGRRPVAAGR
jgi:nucleotide-binding universal stress UspA family protein